MKLVYLGGKRTPATEDDIYLWQDWTKEQTLFVIKWVVQVALTWCVIWCVYVVLAY